jgi:hypothetical protein
MARLYRQIHGNMDDFHPLWAWIMRLIANLWQDRRKTASGSNIKDKTSEISVTEALLFFYYRLDMPAIA